jgi:hypothetical protein
MEQISECLKVTQEMEKQTGSLASGMDAKTDANLRDMKAEIRANNEKCDVLQITLVSWMDIH